MLTTQLTNRSDARLAAVQGAIEAVGAVKAGVERSTRMAEKKAVQAFSKLRRAVDFREKAILKVCPVAKILCLWPRAIERSHREDVIKNSI